MGKTHFHILFLIVFSTFSGCQFHCGNLDSPNSLHTGGYGPMVRSGPEKWNIDGHLFQISATYYLALPEGLQYTIEHPLPEEINQNALINNDAAFSMAFPIMKHAYVNNFYKRGHVARLGKGPMVVSLIGVVIYKNTLQGAKVFRTTMSIIDIENKLKDKSLESVVQPWGAP